MNRTHHSLAMLIALGVFLLASPEGTSLAQRKKPTPAQTPVAESKPIAVQDHEVAGVEVALLEIKRAGANTVTIRWHYRNKTNEAKKLAHGALAGMDNQRFAQVAYFVDSVEKNTQC